MKDGTARQSGVVITKEEGYSGKLEKQVTRIFYRLCSVICFTAQFVASNEEAETFSVVGDRPGSCVTVCVQVW